MSSPWTLERRAQQAEAIRRWRPWEKAIGPKTIDGKARIARNAWKSGKRPELRKAVARVQAYFKATKILLEYSDKLEQTGSPQTHTEYLCLMPESRRLRAYYGVNS